AGLRPGMQASPSSSARARSLSWPSTTSSGSRPAAIGVRAARRRTLTPPSARKSLFFPIRLEVPAASRTPAILVFGMDASAPIAQVQRRAARADREHLGDDAHRDLFRAFCAEVEADGSEQSVGCGPQLLEQFLSAPARPEQAEIRERLRQQSAEPFAIVLQRVRLDDRVMVLSERGNAFARTPSHEPRRRRKALRREIAAAVRSEEHTSEL